jgi:hypothetical protein
MRIIDIPVAMHSQEGRTAADWAILKGKTELLPLLKPSARICS